MQTRDEVIGEIQKAVMGRKTLPRPKSLRSGGRPPEPIQHGTYSGYRKHRDRKIPMCDECRKANSDYRRERRNKTPIVTAKKNLETNEVTLYVPASVLMKIMEKVKDDFEAGMADLEGLLPRNWK